MKKKIIASICAIILVLATVVGTIAYFTDSDSALNTFTVGKVGITFDETDTDNDDNTQDNVTVGTVVRDKANKYHLIPGSTYEKDPTIHVDTGSEDCYLFVKIDNQIAAIEGGETIAQQMAKNGWAAVPNKTGVYVYGTADDPVAAKAKENIIVFSNFTVNGEVDNKTLAEYETTQANQVCITINAYAIQAAGFEDFTAEQIWDTAKF